MVFGSGLYLIDSYVRTCDSTLTIVDDHRFFLDTTIFCPGESGQLPDKGIIAWRGGSAAIAQSQIEDGQIVHMTKDKLPKNRTSVECVLDWQYRYRMMRTHTAMHLVSALAWHYGGGIRLRSRPIQNGITVQFALPFWNHQLFSSIESRANESIRANLPVYTYPLTREEVVESPLLNPLILKKLTPHRNKVRVVEIEGIALDLDMGNHIRTTSEIGGVTLGKARQIARGHVEVDIALQPIFSPRAALFTDMSLPLPCNVKGKTSQSRKYLVKEFYV